MKCQCVGVVRSYGTATGNTGIEVATKVPEEVVVTVNIDTDGGIVAWDGACGVPVLAPE